MTGKMYHYIFNEMPKLWDRIFMGFQMDGNLAIDLAYNMQELIAADTPEAQAAALDNLDVTASALANLALESDIDLSNPERLENFTAVKKKCLSRFLLEVPGMSISDLSRFIDDHVRFVIEFDELGNRELVHRQKALARS